MGILQWTADQTITAFPKFAMVIVDARARVVVSQPFVIQSLTKQPTQQIDLGNGNAGGGRNGNNQNGGKAGKPENKDANKDANKDGKKADNKDANKDGKKADNKEDQQKEKVNDKEEGKQGSKPSLLPLPGLPPNGAPPASLKPLPTVASTPASTQVAAPAPSSSKSSASATTKSVSQETSTVPAPVPPGTEPAPSVPEPAPSVSVPTPPASPVTETEKEPAAAQPAPAGFTTLQPSEEPTPAAPSAEPAEEDKAAAVLDGSLKADAVLPGGSFREQTSDIPVVTSLPSQEGQKTITTAITPRPGRFASSTLRGAAASPTTSALGDAKPTVLSEGGAERYGRPSLVLGVLGAVAGLALL